MEVDNNQQRESNSKITRKYVSFVDRGLKTTDAWLECKRNDDNVGPTLWRVHDDLYDLRDFVARHPGGASWLQMTRGTDITEAVETHHMNMPKVLAIMRNYHVGPAAEPRNCLLTFAENGFYRRLKERVVRRLAELEPHSRTWMSNLILDLLLVANLAAACACTYQPLLILPSGLLLMWLIIGAHNYLHQADNFRMYYFDVALLSFREWRVTHALSHHLFTNSRCDMEMTIGEPLISWWPEHKGWTLRYASWAYEWLLFPLLFLRDAAMRWAQRWFGLGSAESTSMRWPEDAMPLLMPVAMVLFGSGDLGHVLLTWIALVCWGSFVFGATALNGGHHHPEVFHDGDALGEDMDWGLFQMDTMIDRAGIKKANRFAVLTQFGDHILHHLFPTLDHGVLRELYGALDETMEEFGVRGRARARPWGELIAGQFGQMARVERME